MPRYFVELAYAGMNYSGWQIQPNANTVQAELQNHFSRYFNKNISLVGCGRTDTGVHANYFVAHFDINDEFNVEEFIFRIGRMLPKDLHIYDVQKVDPKFHARFSAVSRTYKYILSFQPPIFHINQVLHFPYGHRVSKEKVQEAAELILNYQKFYPFCKSNSQTDHYRCTLMQSYWKQMEDCWVYTVQANRFLRGMVRLLVGMMLNVGLGKLSVEDVSYALKNQERLNRSWSVPATGLYLYDVNYPKFPKHCPKLWFE